MGNGFISTIIEEIKENLNINTNFKFMFKIPTKSGNKYLLIGIDESKDSRLKYVDLTLESNNSKNSSLCATTGGAIQHYALFYYLLEFPNSPETVIIHKNIFIQTDSEIWKISNNANFHSEKDLINELTNLSDAEYFEILNQIKTYKKTFIG